MSATRCGCGRRCSNIAPPAGTLIAVFLAGVLCGALLAAPKPSRRKTVVQSSATRVLIASAGLAARNAPGCHHAACSCDGSLTTCACERMSSSRHLQSGTLVRDGQRIAGALRREGQGCDNPHVPLLRMLRGRRSIGSSLEALVLTAARLGEIRMRRGVRSTWTPVSGRSVPSGGRWAGAHVVPLAPAAIDVFNRAKENQVPCTDLFF